MSTSGRGGKKPRAPISGPLLVLFFGSLAAMALFVLAYQRKAIRPHAYSATGLDVNMEVPAEAQSSDTPAQPLPKEEAAPPPPDGSLTMIQGSGDIRLGGKPASKKEAAAITITRLVRVNEVRYQKIAERYSKASPLLRQYGQEWMKHSDLRKFNNEYFRDHDPIKFAWNVARSPNFASLVKKYAGQKVFLSVIAEFARQTPSELANAGRAYLEADSNAAKLVKKFATAIGLPGEVFAGIAEGTVDPNQAKNAAIKENPALQQFLQQSNFDPNKVNFNR
ncbi:MAG: hypothetical protein HY078_09775 [Elusimicrobia bacterium]|nr:hypothetical protein [Elusimicrobiota bacterium]